MSRSYKSTPISRVTYCASEKKNKQKWHRRMRAWERSILSKWWKEEVYIPHYRQISNIWGFGKDRKRYIGHWDNKQLLMRK